MVSSAVCSSAIIWVLMALRLSGRFSVILATSSLNSRISVEFMETSLIHKWRVRVPGANFVGHGEHFRQSRAIDSGVSAGFAQRGEHLLRGDVPHQIVSRKGTAAKPGERGIEAPAPRFVGGEDFLLGLFGTAVQVDTELNSGDVVLHLSE